MANDPKAVVVDPGSIKVTLSLTFTLGEWRQIVEALQKGGHTWSYPLSGIVDPIRDITSQASKTFYPTEPPRP